MCSIVSHANIYIQTLLAHLSFVYTMSDIPVGLYCALKRMAVNHVRVNPGKQEVSQLQVCMSFAV